MSTVRLRVHYTGHVQGVGFRDTARRIASGFDVVGYVQNLPDGGVELVAEGNRGELDTFLEAVGKSLERRIRSASVVTLPSGDPAFEDFSIRY